jgi:inositol-phosphate transport system permease protein
MQELTNAKPLPNAQPRDLTDRQGLWNRSATWRSVRVHGLMVLSVLPILYMVIWLVLSSIYNYNSGRLSWENWRFLIEPIRYQGVSFPLIWPIVLNTVIFGLTVTVLEICIATPTAYALSRLDFVGKATLLKFLFIMRSFPSITLLITTFFILLQLGLINSMAGVILVTVAGALPGHAYILKGFFDDVPWDLEWSALVDGCSRFTAFYQVVLPAVRSGIAAIAVFAFTGAYGEWLLIRTFIFTNDQLTLAGYMAKLITDEERILNYGLITAIGVFYTLPIAIFYILTQGFLMKANVGGRRLS